MSEKLPSRSKGPFYSDEGTEHLRSTIEQHLLRPCKLKVSKNELNDFAGKLLRFRFLLRDVIGVDKLNASPSKSQEKFHIVDEHQLLRLCQFIWFSPHFSEIMKAQLDREVRFHLANMSEDSDAIREIEEELEDLVGTPAKRYYSEFSSKISDYKRLEGRYLFDAKAGLLEHIKKYFQISYDKSFYFHSMALSIFSRDVYDTVVKLNKDASQQLICKGLSIVFNELFSTKLNRKVSLSASVFKKYVNALDDKLKKEYVTLPEYKLLPQFSSLKISVTIR